jgi:hypothetical protein
VHPTSDDGSPLNAEYSVVPDDPHLSLILESAGGRSAAAGQARNSDYRAALTLLLRRLGERLAVVTDALVDSTNTRGLPEAQRRVITGPIALSEVTDFVALRRSLTTAQGRIGQTAGAPKAGNNSKRLRLLLEVPGYGSSDAERLEAEPGSFHHANLVSSGACHACH